MSLQPKPYDLTDPRELRRLFIELEGYMRVSLRHGTDTEGREFAYEALRKFNHDPECRELREAVLAASGVKI